jgi:hypothetical protein
MSNVIRGTIKELIAQKLKVNGVELGQAEFSVITRLGNGSFATNVGTADREPGKKGKPSTIWEINPNATFSVTVG